MKKRMFLTTSIVVLLLLVALSTATFAWFSASNVVNVSVISFIASSSNASGGDLAIAWTEDGVDTYEISFAKNFDMNPMIPQNAPYIGQTYESFLSYEKDDTVISNFHSSAQSYIEEEEKYCYVGAILSETPKKCVSVNGLDEFYLINKNADFAQNVTVKYEISGDNAKALCVALFADGILIGIMGGGENLYYGDIVSGAAVDTQSFLTNVISASEEINFQIDAGGIKKMQMLAWYSGVDLDNSGAEKTATLSALKFVGDYAG